MPFSRLPIDIKNFLNEYIDSVTHLEVLLMLYTHHDTLFNAQAISKELRTNTRSAEAQLKHLAEKGLLSVDEKQCYQYKPISEELHKRVISVYDIYKVKPVAVVACIFDKPTEKLKDLSNAFKLKKD